MASEAGTEEVVVHGDHAAVGRGSRARSGLLESFLAGDRRRALAGGTTIDHEPVGAGLFADISGFTPLTEALARSLGPHHGAEVLTENLNRIYEAIIDDLAHHGGVVLYFSGDAITCWLDGDDGTRAAGCALAMQRTIGVVGLVTIPDGSTIQLSIKVAIATGRASRFVVGEPSLGRIDVLAGRILDRLAAAEQLADKGDVIADESVLRSLGDRLVCTEQRIDLDVGRMFGVVGHLEGPEPTGSLRQPLPELGHEVVREWIVPDVFRRLTAGAGDFLAELRPAHPIFVRFGGFDFDADPGAAACLDEFIRAVQATVDHYGGATLGLTIGDKGAYIIAVVGAPRSHDDDAFRAVAAAIDIRDLEGTGGARDVQVGVSCGQIYAGTYGHPDRRTFSCLGDPVNLAARLMGSAPVGAVYVHESVAELVDDRFEWESVPPLKLKGKQDAVVARSAISRSTSGQRVRRYELPMVGRDAELASVMEAWRRASAGTRTMVTVSAEAGMGKSRFVAEVLRAIDPTQVAYGQADALGRTTSYLVWRDVWRTVFGLGDDEPEADQRRRVEGHLAAIGPDLVLRAPLLGPVLALEIPDNDLVSHFDPKLRKSSRENLLASVFRARLAAGPLVVVLEDAQWLDDPSLDLLEVLARETSADDPVLFLLSCRLDPTDPRPARLDQLPGNHEIVLHELGEDGLRDVAVAKTAQVFGVGAVPSEALIDLIHDRADGNPFYAEELVNFVRRSGLDPADPDIVAALELPANLHGIVLSRIDALDELPRQGLKVASVIGREFDAGLLPRAHPPLGRAATVLWHLRTLQRADLVVAEDEDEATWMFRHGITRDVAYDSIPFGLRAPLHEAVGDAIAGLEPDGADFDLDLLAHHYWLSDNTDKKRVFLARAAVAARAAFANAAAIVHYERLAEITDDVERPALLLDLADVLQVVGDWTGAEVVARDALALAERHDHSSIGWCQTTLAEITRKQGRFEEAVELLERATDAFATRGEEAGTARALHLLGTIAAQHGDLAVAKEHYEHSRVLRERLDDRSGLASLLSNLGVVAEYEGDYDTSKQLQHRALDLREEIGDRGGIAVSCTNLGMLHLLERDHSTARELFEEAMHLNTLIGDTWMVALTHNNLGNVNRDAGASEAARAHYADAFATYRRLDDHWALAFLLEDVALFAAAEGAAEAALEFLGGADRLREEGDAPRPDALEDELMTRLGEHLATLDANTQERARDRGRRWPLSVALDHASQYCAP